MEIIGDLCMEIIYLCMELIHFQQRKGCSDQQLRRTHTSSKEELLFIKFFKKAEVIKRNITSRGVLGEALSVSEHCRKSSIVSKTAVFYF